MVFIVKYYFIISAICCNAWNYTLPKLLYCYLKGKIKSKVSGLESWTIFELPFTICRNLKSDACRYFVCER
jgi:hypothetical protein